MISLDMIMTGIQDPPYDDCHHIVIDSEEQISVAPAGGIELLTALDFQSRYNIVVMEEYENEIQVTFISEEDAVAFVQGFNALITKLEATQS